MTSYLRRTKSKQANKVTWKSKKPQTAANVSQFRWEEDDLEMIETSDFLREIGLNLNCAKSRDKNHGIVGRNQRCRSMGYLYLPFPFLVQSISEALCTPQFGGVFQKQEEEQAEEISEERHSAERGVPSLREPRKQS